MLPKFLSAFSGPNPPVQQPTVTLRQGHRTLLRFNDSRTPLFLLTCLSPALVRDFYMKARDPNNEEQLEKDFTNMPRPVTAAAMELVMDLLAALQHPQEPVVATGPPSGTTTGTLFTPSTPPFVPLQSRHLYAASPTPRLIDAAFLASRLELEAPFEGLAAEIGRRLHKLVTFGGVPWSRSAKHYIQNDFPPDESVLHAVCRPNVAVSATADLLAEIAAGLRREVGLSDRASGAAAAERFADLAVLFNMRDADAVSSRRDDKAALRRLLRRRWQPDEEAQQCKACKVTFRLVAGVLRSHCRRCGDVYCKSCVEAYTTSKAFATLEKPDAADSGDGPRKICRTCHEVVGEGTVARFYMELIEGMGLSIPDVRALMLLDDTWEAATVEVLWQYRNHMYMMRPSAAHNAIVLNSMGVASNHPEFLLRILEVEALWLLPADHPTVKQMLGAAMDTFRRGGSHAMLSGCGQLYCTRACDNSRKDIGTFAVRVLRALAHREVPQAALVRKMALMAMHVVLSQGTERSGAPLNADAWLHALLDMYFSTTTCQSARGTDVEPVTESELVADRSKVETRLRTLLDAIVYIAVRSDKMRMKVVCEIAYRQSTKDTAVSGWCSILAASMSIARSNYEIVSRVREKTPTPTCFSDVQAIGTFQTVLMTLVRCAQDALFETEHEVRATLFGCFPREYQGKTANDTIWFPRPAPYFFNPRKYMHGIVMRDVKLHSSNTRPAGIVFLVSDTAATTDRDEAKCERARVILKRDRLRQDQICCEVAALLPQLMQADAPPHKILSYHVLPLTEECGIVEMLENAPNLQTLTKDEGKTLAEFLLTQVTGREDTRCTFFLNSVRYLVMLSLVLGLGDRHRSNMVLDRSQLQLCHIDFGRVLGDRTVFEKADRLLNFCRTGTWDPKDIVVRFDDELAAAVHAMGENPERFIHTTVRLVVNHVRPNVELLYMVMSRLLEEPRQQQRSNLLSPSFGAQPDDQRRTALYSADSSRIGLLSYQRATAPRYDRAGQLIVETEDASAATTARRLRERSPGYTDPVYQYLHQCLRTSQKDQAVIRELCGLLRSRNRPIQDGSHWVNQAALSEGGWLNYGWGHVSAVSTAAASSASEVATTWFGTVTDRATVLFSAAGVSAAPQ